MVLMERAALQVADLICSRYERTKRVLCLCGCGNNGGDGVAVARILYERGWQVSYTIVGNQEKMTPALKSQVETARVSNVRYKEFEYICQQDDGYDIVVDALFGTGISREIGGVFLQAIQWAVGQTEHIVSVDIPSRRVRRYRTDHGNGCEGRSDSDGRREQAGTYFVPGQKLRR